MDSTDFDPVRVLETKNRELSQLQSELRRLKSAYEEALAKPTSMPPIQVAVGVQPLHPQTTEKPTVTIESFASSKEKKKLSELGSAETLTKLKEIFQQYASIQTITLMDKMELAQFRRFIKDAKLVPQIASLAQADIWFFHKNRGKNVTFLRWVQILCEFGKLKFDPQASDCLDQLLSEVILNDTAIRISELSVANWRDRMDDAALQLELRKAVPHFDQVFNTFCSLTTGTYGQLPLDQYVALAAECHLVPELLSMRDAIKVFRAVQRDPFSDLLTREEFYTSMCCLSLQVFGEKGNGEAVGELARWLEKSAQEVRVTALRRGRSSTKQTS